MRLEGRKPRPPDVAFRRAFGHRLASMRDAAGLSQEKLALRINMSRRYLSAIETGGANPTLDQIKRLAVGIGCQPRDLMPDVPQRSR